MTPEQKIKWAIIMQVYTNEPQLKQEIITDENIDDLYDELEDYVGDVIDEFREGEVETDIPCEDSRYYESYSVAAEIPDGSWVGWTYWFGGGKHGEPEAIPWMEDAYELDCVKEEKMVIQLDFTKKKG